MPLRNIYFSGPDGTRKSTLAHEAARYLDLEGFHVRVVHFPSETGPMGAIIHLRERFGEQYFAEAALDVAYAADRLDIAHHKLRKLREQDPDVIFIFDRGPVDGVVYAVARDTMRDEPLGMTFDYMENADRKFVEMYPPDLGICLLSPVTEAQRLMEERGRRDQTDANLGLQTLLNGLFREYLGGRPEWHIVDVNRYPGENRRAQAERLVARVKVIIRNEIKKVELEGNPRLSSERLR